MDIYKMEVATGKVTNLTSTSPVWDANPACSPVSDQIAFVSDRAGGGGKDTDQIWVMDIAGKNLQQLTNAPGWENVQPGWSPDGLEIAFYRAGIFGAESSGPAGLWAIKADGSEERLVIEYEIIFAGGNSPPAWSPDGQWIAYNSGLGEKVDVYAVSSQGGKPVKLSNSVGVNDDYSWSSSSSYLLFTNIQGEESLVYLVQITDPSPTPMYPEPGIFMARFAPQVDRP
jgi:TolB protein